MGPNLHIEIADRAKEMPAETKKIKMQTWTTASPYK
jgi:hypothetical protein